jgi:lanthanide-dependent methanol dehydrogenase
MFARKPDTGEAVWFYQTSPHDLFDHDGVNELVLADLKLDDRIRKIAMRADRSGLLYMMDRTNGEVLSAAPFGYVNSNGRPWQGNDSTSRVTTGPEHDASTTTQCIQS